MNFNFVPNLTIAFLARPAALRPLSSGMLCCVSKAKSMKGCCFFTFLKPCGDPRNGGVGENDEDEEAIFSSFAAD